MSVDFEHRRTVKRRVVLSPLYPRVRVWSPIPQDEALYDIAGLDRSIQGVIIPEVSHIQVPPKDLMAVSDVYSNDTVLGFEGDKIPFIVGAEYASFVMFKGSLLQDIEINGQFLPAEMRVAILQSTDNRQFVTQAFEKAKDKVKQYRKVQRRGILQVG